MRSLSEWLQLTLQIGGGSVFIMGAHLKSEFDVTLRSHACERPITFVSVDDRSSKACHSELLAAASARAVVVLVGEREFPNDLAHLAYVFNKGDGLIDHRGAGIHNTPKFNLICWMTPRSWLSIAPHYRDQLRRATIPGVHCFFQSVAAESRLAELEERRWKAEADPLKALREARSFEDRHSLFLDLFPPSKPDGDFSSYDEELVTLIDAVSEADDNVTQADLMEIFTRHNDFYLAHQAMRRQWECSESTLDRLADTVVSQPSVRGERQHFWDLVAELSARGEQQVNQFLVSTSAKGGRGSEREWRVG